MARFGRWLLSSAESCDCDSSAWLRTEWIYWHTTRQHSPPLATVSNAGPDNLALGKNNTILFGDDNMSDWWRNGGRLSAGFWFPDASAWGLDMNLLLLMNRKGTYRFESGGTPSVGLPFFQVGPGLPDTNTESFDIVSQPGAPGQLVIDQNTRTGGFEVSLRHKWKSGPCWKLDTLFGFRYFELSDRLYIHQTHATDPAFVIMDHFDSRNIFMAPQIGFDGEWTIRPRWTVGGTFKLAVGNTYQVLDIAGLTSQVNPFALQRGGVYALPTNSGRHLDNRWGFLPELGLKLAYEMRPNMRIYVGYNILFLNDVIRAAEQIDRRLNTTQFPFANNGQPGTLRGAASPLPHLETSSFWAQGVSVGMEWRY